MNFLVKLFLLTFLTSSVAWTYQLTSELKVNSNQELEKNLVAQCRPDETFCYELCQNQNLCKIQETFCQDCVSQNTTILQLVFTDLLSVFKSEFAVRSHEEMLYFFKNHKFISISYDSILNMYTPEKKSQLAQQFNQLCFLKTAQDGLLLATLDSENKLKELVGVVCTVGQKSVVLPVKVNPQFSRIESDFWNQIEAAVHQQVEGLKLKLDLHLK